MSAISHALGEAISKIQSSVWRQVPSQG